MMEGGDGEVQEIMSEEEQMRAQQVQLVHAVGAEGETDFQKIVRKRGEDFRAMMEQERQEGLRRIEENQRKSRESSYFDLLPDEMRDEIVSHLKDPEDQKSLYESHLKFRPLNYLFSQVLAIFLRHMSTYYKRMSWPKLSSFRTLSRSIKTAIDRSYQNDFMKILRGSRGDLRCCYEIHTPKVLDKILKNFTEGPESTRAERCFHRSVRFRVNIFHEPVEFREKMRLLLQVIGEQLWNFSFCVNLGGMQGLGISADETYLLLQEWVSYMPNLKWLEVDIQDMDSYTCSENFSAEIFANHPFPHLALLERINLGCFKNCIRKFDVAASMVRRNLHIKILDLLYFLDSDDKPDTPFPAEEIDTLLSSLNLEVFHLHNQYTPKMDLYRALHRMNWTLRSLTWTMNQGFRHSLQSVFTVLNSFPQLERLTLHLGWIIVEEGVPSLRLPNLTELEFEFRIRSRNIEPIINSSSNSNSKNSLFLLFSLQFLFQSKNLKALVWWPRMGNDEQRTQLRDWMISYGESQGDSAINFMGGIEDQSSSNIWQVFPRLRHLRTLSMDDGHSYEYCRGKEIMSM